jgi:ATP-dependent RNA helicase RhlE
VQFNELNLIDPLLRAVHAEGYTEPTPIQAQAIPYILNGRDLLGCAQTGTGKTAAFALPILQGLQAQGRGRGIRVLVLSPTRELAAQIGDSFAAYGRNLPFRHTVIFGGVGQQPQVDALRRGVDILVATPGRLLDLMGQRLVSLDNIQVFVLDEADRMLDMGFIHDVRRVIAMLPKKRQTLLFSATMPDDIQELADSILINPAYVEVTPRATTVEKIDQRVYFVEKNDKPALLEHLLRDRAIRRVLVFTRTKHGANKVVKKLGDAGIGAEAIHGNKSQSARERALANFKSGETRVLVATDIAARGLDVEDITHVINYDLPNIPETYVHRIGRTARAGASGMAFSFCDQEEREYLRDIEKTIRKRVPVVDEHPHRSPLGTPGSSYSGAIRTSQPSSSQRQNNPPRRDQPTSGQRQNNPPRRETLTSERRMSDSRPNDSVSNRPAAPRNADAPMGEGAPRRRRRRRSSGRKPVIEV